MLAFGELILPLPLRAPRTLNLSVLRLRRLFGLRVSLIFSYLFKEFTKNGLHMPHLVSCRLNTQKQVHHEQVQVNSSRARAAARVEVLGREGIEGVCVLYRMNAHTHSVPRRQRTC